MLCMSLKCYCHQDCEVSVCPIVQIFKADTEIPEYLSPGAQNIIRKILDPNPTTRINVAMIKEDEWFKKDYIPIVPTEDEEEDLSIIHVCPIKDQVEQ